MLMTGPTTWGCRQLAEFPTPQIEVSTSPGSGSAVPGPWAGMEARHGTAAAPIRGLLSHQPSTSSQPGSLMQTRSRAASLIAAVPGAEVSPAHEARWQKLFSRAWLQPESACRM